jgi:hypothetical protein
MATVPNSGDQGTFTMPFTISAGGSDVYVGGHVGTDVTFTTTPTSSAGAVSLSGSTLTTASTVAGDSAGSYYKILAGTSRTFTLTAVYTATNMPGGAGYTGLMMTGISYGATSALGSTYTDLSSFKTNDIYLSYH